MSNEIFINYRRFDAEFAALYLERYLADHFGPYAVFRDSGSIPLGSDFPPLIWEALRTCRVTIAIIGNRWLRRGPGGRRLIDMPGDWVRREVAEALRRDIRVIPVLVEEARLPAARLLPASVRGLATRQYVHLRVRSAEDDATRLVTALTEILDSPRSAVHRTDRHACGCQPPARRNGGDRRGKRSSA